MKPLGTMFVVAVNTIAELVLMVLEPFVVAIDIINGRKHDDDVVVIVKQKTKNGD